MAIQARPTSRHPSIVGTSQAGLTLALLDRCGGV
jgi:hypothetical protein